MHLIFTVTRILHFNFKAGKISKINEFDIITSLD